MVANGLCSKETLRSSYPSSPGDNGLIRFRAFNFGDFLAYKAQQPLPKSLAAHEAELNDFVDRCRKLCAKILELFAIGLKVGASAISVYKAMLIQKVDRRNEGREKLVHLSTRSFQGTFGHRSSSQLCKYALYPPLALTLNL